MRPAQYIALFIAPVVALIVLLYLRNVYDRKSYSLLVKSYFLGMFGVILVLLAKYISDEIGISDLRNLKRTLFFAFVTTGFASELGKFIMLRFFIMPRRKLDSSIYTIVLSIISSLGFATVAIIVLMLDFLGIREIYPSILFDLSYVPASVIFAIIMGFFLGTAKFYNSRFFFFLTGLAAAAIFHGIYKFCILTSDWKLLSLFAFGSVIIVFVMTIKAILQKDTSKEEP
ncbi:MAG: PrsW family intramembrane metalloprotease [Bacteroidetes bacterium]|nr:PrsW family intramembrane metalloprotease [Bacteroidota bacterium]